MVDSCSECGSEGVQVDIEVRQEGDNNYSREPYRVVECGQCGYKQAKRMNKV